MNSEEHLQNILGIMVIIGNMKNIAQQLPVFAALAEDQGLVPSIHKGFQEINTIFGNQAHTWYI